MRGLLTNRSLKSMLHIFMSTIEATFKTLEIKETSAVELSSSVGIAGKSNSIKKLSSDLPLLWTFENPSCLTSGTFLAVRIPERVENSIMLEFTKPVEKSTCAAANVAWPQSSTCKKSCLNQKQQDLHQPNYFICLKNIPIISKKLQYYSRTFTNVSKLPYSRSTL